MKSLALRLPAALLAASLVAGCSSAGTRALPNTADMPATHEAFGNTMAPRALQPRNMSKIGSGWTDPEGVAVDEKTKIVYVLDGSALKKIDPSDGRVTTVLSGFSAPTSVAVDSSNHSVYVADPHQHKITEVQADGTASIISNLSLPASVAVDSVRHELYVGDIGTHEVFAIHPLDPSVHVPFKLGIDAYGLAVQPDAGAIYAADPALNSVFKIAAQGHSTPVGSGWAHPNGVAFDSSNKHLYVSAVGGVWDVAPDGTKTAVGSGFALPRNVAVDSAANRVYVADQLGKAVYRITNASSEIVKHSARLGLIYSLAFDTGTHDIYVDSGLPANAAIVRISPSGTGTVVQGSGGLSALLAVDSRNHELYQLLLGEGDIIKYTPSGQQVGVPGKFLLPTAFAIDQSTNDLYVGHGNQVIKVAPNGTATSLEKGIVAAGLAVDPHTHDVYVSDLDVVRKYAPDGTVAERIEHLDLPKLLAFDPVSNTLYVTTIGNDLKAVTSDRKVETIAHFQSIGGFALDPFNINVYVSDLFGTIWKFTP